MKKFLKLKTVPTPALLGYAAFFLLLALLIAFFSGLLPVRPVAVATGSMEPSIHVGDVVLVCRSDPDKLEAGDVIQYQAEGYTVIHRIVAADEASGGLVTQGDANNAPDAQPVLPGQVLGRVVLTLPGLGKPSLWLHALLSGG